MNPSEVEILVSFDTWSAGFEVIDTHLGAEGTRMFRVRRRSDGEVLPVAFAADRIRPANSAPRAWS